MHVINCGRAQIAMSHNLWLCMLRLRQPNDQQVLWIDALCISQEDSRKRTQQVQMMQRIYQSATETIVWLGDHSNGVKEGIVLAKKLAELDRATFDSSTWTSAQNVKQQPFESTGLDELDSASWKPLDNLFWSPWFTRAWMAKKLHSCGISPFALARRPCPSMNLC